MFKTKFIQIFILLLVAVFSSSADAWSAKKMRKAKQKSFFVLTESGFDGALGGRLGATFWCKDDLVTYDWKGKNEAVLNDNTIKAFLCDSTGCNDLKPNRTYYYAASNKPTIGGDRFTTNSLGQGPGSPSSWTSSVQFGTPGYYVWTGRAVGSDPNLWESATAANHCNNWSSGTNTFQGNAGGTNLTNQSRWNDNLPSSCNTGYKLICIVEPP
jgi:hypothetical protein